MSYFFRKETFNLNYPLCSSVDSEPLLIPDVKEYKDFYNWTKSLPNIESPEWSGLPLNVERINRIRQAEALITRIKLIQGSDDSELQGQSQSASSAEGQV